jgi:hypothetical protein
MASPIPGSNRIPRSPKQPILPPHGDPRIGPNPPKLRPTPKKPLPVKPGKDKPYPMPGPIDDMAFPNPGMSKYTSIKKTKQVNKTYNTY